MGVCCSCPVVLNVRVFPRDLCFRELGGFLESYLIGGRVSRTRDASSASKIPVKKKIKQTTDTMSLFRVFSKFLCGFRTLNHMVARLMEPMFGMKATRLHVQGDPFP